MFPVQPQSVIVRSKKMRVPKTEKWADMLPEMLHTAFVDGSRDERGVVEFASYGIWFGEGDGRNEQAPILVSQRQSITRAEVTAALRVLQKKCLGQPLHLVMDSELVYFGLTSASPENGVDIDGWDSGAQWRMLIYGLSSGPRGSWGTVCLCSGFHLMWGYMATNVWTKMQPKAPESTMGSSGLEGGGCHLGSWVSKKCVIHMTLIPLSLGG